MLKQKQQLDVAPPPPVAPPLSYKTPSLPTLAAIGVISAAALIPGCAHEKITAGDLRMPRDYTVEKNNTVQLRGETILPTLAPEKTAPEEKTSDLNIPEGGDVEMLSIEEP